MKTEKNKILGQEVMAKIHQDKVKMRPRFYFIVGSFLLALGLAIDFILAVFFFMLVVFRIRLHAPFGYFWFGKSGFSPFMATFPWLFIFLGAAAILAGILFLKKYDFSYKKNFLLLVFWLVVLIIGAGILLDQIGFNEKANQFETIRGLYDTPFGGEDWLVGEIKAIEDQAMTIETPHGEDITIFWDQQTKLPSGQDFILGDKIKAVGQWQVEGFTAQGIDQAVIRWRKGKGPNPPLPRPEASLKSQFLKSVDK